MYLLLILKTNEFRKVIYRFYLEMEFNVDSTFWASQDYFFLSHYVLIHDLENMLVVYDHFSLL